MERRYKYPGGKTIVLISILIAFLKPFTINGQECNYSVEFYT